MKYCFRHLLDFVDLSTFSLHKFSINYLGRLALVSTTNYLIITDGVMHDNSDDVEGEIDDTVMKLYPGAIVTALLWISDDLVCLGFATGSISIFNVEGTMICERQYKQEAVKSFRVVSGWLWVLYQGFLVQIDIADMLHGLDENSVISILVENTVMNDFVVLSTVYVPSVFGVRSRDEEITSSAYSVLIGGMSEDTTDIGGGGAFALYNINATQQHFQHLGKVGTYVKAQVGAVLTRALQSLSLMASPPPTTTTTKSTTKTLASLVDFDDPKRQILHLTQDPAAGSLIAAADSAGRVLLYDSCIHVVVRLWKGVRDAQLAWSSSPISLSLAIFAPQIGLVSFYGMVHGPCLRVIPVPNGCQCQLYTSISNSSKHNRKIAKCYLAMTSNDNSGGGKKYDSILINALDPSAKDQNDLDTEERETSSSSSSFIEKHALAEVKEALQGLTSNEAAVVAIRCCLTSLTSAESLHEVLTLLEEDEVVSKSLEREVCEYVIANAKTKWCQAGVEDKQNANRKSLESTRNLIVRIKKSLVLVSKIDPSEGWKKTLSDEADALLNLITML